ncbi:hypothetical protein H6G76_29635 [Nostoc sp. FACHB-152]|uniref:hypothetical protein n=1 Tax=unclassified Nostoc TaxID=2593658 RepID=UPI0016871A7A|nr:MULTISPECIES: hypothetical protein [unclassified Nostoc]MBD2451220.1 hypothetical protein [Nostoc sp. FACHB-152]MBD2472232.1 hypothetical protein [Nostoc sp. FACHB-145]
MSRHSANQWLKSHLPDLVVLRIDSTNQWQTSLALIANLAASTASVACIINTDIFIIAVNLKIP